MKLRLAKFLIGLALVPLCLALAMTLGRAAAILVQSPTRLPLLHAFAGVAGIAIELVRLFQVELQHYEKVEGIPLSLDGKANRLGALVRGNLDKAMAGLAVVPMLTGWDIERRQGRIFSYDATGGRYEETGFHAIGSGAAFARGSLKKTHHRDLGEDDAIAAAIRSLYDAADDDSATGRPNLARNIFPVVMSASARGVRQLSSDQVADITTRVLETL